mmetsp:Transcript_13238/g.55488  ORF Transcript_13238/g.55488 Transcript_13238/m.55488 type:complete len:284 (+) Transcript_13238:100-951(+)
MRRSGRTPRDHDRACSCARSMARAHLVSASSTSGSRPVYRVPFFVSFTFSPPSCRSRYATTSPSLTEAGGVGRNSMGTARAFGGRPRGRLATGDSIERSFFGRPRFCSQRQAARADHGQHQRFSLPRAPRTNPHNLCATRGRWRSPSLWQSSSLQPRHDTAVRSACAPCARVHVPTHGTDARDDTPPIQAEARWAPTQTTAPASTRQHRHLCSTRKHLCSNLTRCRGRSGKRGKFWRGAPSAHHLRRAVGGDAHPRRGLRRLGWRLVLGAPLAARARSSHGVV